jgi:hypothetical protein
MTQTHAAVQQTHAAKPRKRNNVQAVLSQYLAEKQYSLLIPIYILVIYWAISAVIVLFIGIKTGLPLPAAMQEDNASGNIGSIMSFPSFLIVAGALCVNRQFNAALSFGSTRRDFWFGTTLGFLLTSATTGVFAMLGLALEKMTNHWWFGVHAFDVSVLGSGNYVIAFLVVFTLCLTSLLIGATFGTIFRSWGQLVLTWSIIGTVIVLLAGLAICIWQSEALVRFFTPWGCWTLIAGFGLVSVVLDVAGYFINQHATV